MAKRSRNLFDPSSKEPFKLSRTRLDNFLRCPRCFYLDRRLGLDRPSMPGFTLNIAVDALLKKEFDLYRSKGEPHPLMVKHGLNAVPFKHPDLDKWRANFEGIEYHHKPTNLILTGAVDDLWVTPERKLIVVDYKATSKDGEVTLDDEWKEGYKRQMEIYQWILRGMSFDVQDTGYFVYANGRKDVAGFNGVLCFFVTLIPYEADSSWVEKAVFDAAACLKSDSLPAGAPDCEFCAYRKSIRIVETAS